MSEYNCDNNFMILVLTQHHLPSLYSSIITGRNPFGKDTAALDYEVDSEAEWEEGDDDQGEDLNEDVGDEEEDEVPQDEDNDGWLAAEDDLGIDDEDEETREVSSLHA